MRFCGTFKEGKIPYAEAEIVPYFLRFCELKGLSPFTVSLYKEKLDRFFRFLQGKTPVTSQDLLEFIGWLRERQPAPESQNIHLRSLKIFFRWAVAQSYLKKNPMHGVPMVRQRQKLITPLTISELQRLLDCARKTKQTGYRNTAIILLMVDTACWPGELCSLTLRDVRFEENLIRVDEKCGQRMLPISPSTRRALFTRTYEDGRPFQGRMRFSQRVMELRFKLITSRRSWTNCRDEPAYRACIPIYCATLPPAHIWWEERIWKLYVACWGIPPTPSHNAMSI